MINDPRNTDQEDNALHHLTPPPVITFVVQAGDMNFLAATLDMLEAEGYVQTPPSAASTVAGGFLLDFRHSGATSQSGARVIFTREGAWRTDPFQGDWHNEPDGTADTADNLKPRPIIVRTDASEVPEFLFPAIVPDSYRIEACNVIDLFRTPDRAAEALAVKLGLRECDPASNLAEAILIQSQWSSGLAYDLFKKEHSTNSKALAYVDPTLDLHLPVLLESIINNDNTKLQDILRQEGAKKAACLPLSGGYTLLHWAALFGADENVIDSLLDTGIDINTRNQTGVTALYNAVWHSEELAEFFLQRGANPLIISIFGDTALHPAAFFGYQDLVGKLLESGLSPYITNINGGHPLLWAAQAGHTALVDTILAKDPEGVDTLTGTHGIGSDDPDFSPDADGLSSFCRYRRRQALHPGLSGRTALMAAARGGMAETVSRLLEYNVDPNLADHFGCTPLHLSILAEQNAFDTLQTLLLCQHINIDAQDAEGFTPLHYAIIEGHKEIAITLLDKEANPEIGTNNASTALHLAVIWCRTELIKLLCKNADMSKHDRDGFSVLHLSLNLPEPQPAIISVLIANGSDPNQKSRDGLPPLAHLLSSHNCGAEEKRIIVGMLLDNGADPFLTDNNEIIPFIIAAINGDIDFCTPLFERIDLTRPHQRLNSLALVCAAALGQQENVRQLVEAGVSINWYTPDGLRPLAAAALGGHLNTVEYLLEHITMPDWAPGSLSALVSATKNGHAGIVSRLLQAGADPNAPSFKGYTPLHIATTAGHVAIVQLLLANGAFPDSRAHDGTSPLHHAALSENIELGKELIQAGANVSALDNDGDTPLHLAIRSNNIDFIKILINKNVPAQLENNDGHRPADMTNNIHTLKFLLENGIDVVMDATTESSRASFLSWNPLPPVEYTDLLQLTLTTKCDGIAKDLLQRVDSSKLLYASLPFYDESFIVAIPDPCCRPPNELFMIYSKKHRYVVQMDWTNDPIFQSNERLAWTVDPQRALIYLRFFFHFVRTRTVSFIIANNSSELNWTEEADDELRRQVDSRLENITLIDDAPEGMLRFHLTCLFKKSIFATDAFLACKSLNYKWPEDDEPTEIPAGEFRLRNEELLFENLPIRLPEKRSKYG
jgi:ankyrin